ncbi:MAG: iduronate-2-sulfatase [Planctomycetaceae bacterium]|nr:iduronate-2-sulfatase [Planctomycetaceae bacterium]
MRYHFTITLIFFCLQLDCISFCSATETNKPNVLFLICDDLNCDLGCYGHPLVQSPHIDHLARRGVRFENAYCQFPLCGPSRASFMTGLYPDQTGILQNAVYVRKHLTHVQTMPQMFRKQGYFATRIGKIFHYGVPKHIGTSGHDDPFSWDYTINPRGRDKDDEDLIFSLEPGKFGGTLSWLAADGTDEQQTDGIAATEAGKLLEQYAEQGKHFFLAVGLYRPHTPYVAPKKYFDLYPLDQIKLPTVPPGYLDSLPLPARKSLTHRKAQRNLPEDLARQAIQAYYSSITFADAQVGRILDTLEQTGLTKNTIVVFTSDHGYHMGEHGHWQKTTLFENAARVPLILATPNATNAGTTTTALAEMIDIYPTLADLCSIDRPAVLAGVSLAPVLSDLQHQPRQAALTQYANGYSLRTARYRYTEWGEQGVQGIELYDHQHDPNEMRNLAKLPEHSHLIDQLAQQLHKRIAVASKLPKIKGN